MELLLSPTFARQLKKLHRNQKSSLDRALQQLMENPHLGEAKGADLEGIFIWKFMMHRIEWLIAYRLISEESLKLLLIGTMKTSIETSRGSNR